MKSNVRFCWSLFLLVAAAPALAEDQMPWVADFQTACGMAAEQHRLVLLHFYNDNCGPCVRLEQNVFNKLNVAEAVAQNYLAVKIHAGKNPQLATRYRIQQWPTDVFVTPSGLEVFRTISPQKPEEYIAVLNQVAQQTGVGAARQWKNLMAQTLQPAASTASTVAGNLPNNAQRTTQQAADQIQTAASQTQQRWGAVPTQFQTATAQARSTAERATQDFASAAQLSTQQVTATAQQAAAATQQVERQATDKLNQATDKARQWSQQATDAVQSYEKQGGDSYRQFREQANASAQQMEKQADSTRQQWQATAQHAAQDVGEATQGLKSQLHQAGQSLFDRRSAFVSAEPSPATQPAAAAAAANANPSSSPTVSEATSPKTPPPLANVQPPVVTANPWVGANQAAQPPFVTATPQPTNPPATANAKPPLVPASQAPAVALDGFCPVTLMETMAHNPGDHAAWKKGDKRFGAIHRGRTFLFTSAEQQQKFLANPDAYAPVLSGCDPVLYAERGQMIDGKRAYGLVTPEKQIYLFADESSLNRFKQSPTSYSAAIQQAMARNEGGNIYR